MAAPEEYTIQQVFTVGDPWDKNPSKRTDEILFEGDARTYRVFRPADDPHSEVGEKLSGWKNDDGTFGIADKNFKGGGGRRADSPETVARIIRSHSQEMAIRLIAATGDAVELDLSAKADVSAYLNTVLKPLVDWFDKDVVRAAEAVKSKGSAESNGSGDAAVAATGDDDIPF